MSKSAITFRLKKSSVLALCFALIGSISGCSNGLKTSDVATINSQNENETYVLWAGDTISLKFFYNKNLNDEVVIRPDGKISLQLIGEVNAAGLTPSQLESLLTQKYSKVLYAGNIKPESTSTQQPEPSGIPYILSVSDTIAIKFFYNKDLNEEVIIRPDGKISLQLIGEVEAAGLTPAQLQSLLIRKYSKVLHSEDINSTEGDNILDAVRQLSARLNQLDTLAVTERPRTSYILSVGDKISIEFSYNDELNNEVIIRPDGKISLKRIGEVKAAGLTTEQLRTILVNMYSKILYVGDTNSFSGKATQSDTSDVLPESPYMLGVGSSLIIKFPYNEELNDEVTIRPDGKISLQLIGEVKAAGLSPQQLESLLTQKYSQFIDSPKITVIVKSSKLPELTVIVKDVKLPQLTVIVKDFRLPQVTVSVKSSAARKVYVGGEVAVPGMVPIYGMLRLSDAVTQRGGAQTTANLEHIIFIRYNGTSEPDVYYVNLRKIMRGESEDIILKPYDVVYLPRTAISEVGLITRQYLHNLIPVQFNVIYNLNPQVQIKD